MNDLHPHERIRALREGGHTRRCHTVPHHGHYEVANHSWHVVTLLYVLHPDPSPALIRAAHFHDVAERWTGDIPATAKWMSETFKNTSNEIEKRVRQYLGVEEELTYEEIIWLKACDMLELHLWVLDQFYIGNTHIGRMQKNIQEWLESKKDTLPKAVLDMFSNYRYDRSSDYLPEMQE